MMLTVKSFIYQTNNIVAPVVSTMNIHELVHSYFRGFAQVAEARLPYIQSYS